MSNSLSPIVIDLTAAKNKVLNETFYGQFASGVKLLIKYLFGDVALPVKMKEGSDALVGPPNGPEVKLVGTPSEISSFINALGHEKTYMRAYVEKGLNDPETLNSRHKLNRAVEEFEQNTQIRWPFKN